MKVKVGAKGQYRIPRLLNPLIFIVAAATMALASVVILSGGVIFLVLSPLSVLVPLRATRGN